MTGRGHRASTSSAGLRSTLLAAGCVISVLCCASAAFAASEEHGGGASELIYQGINLVIVIAVLFYAARKPAVQFFRDRRESIQGSLSQAADLLSEAEARNSEIQRRLVDLQSEIEEIRENTRRRAEDESERILAEARKSAERIHADASAAVDQELQRARRELRAEASDLALELAAQILRERVGDADRERLVDEFITRIETPAQDGSGRPAQR